MADRPAESENTPSDLVDSFLHRIAARARLLRYTYMIISVVDNIEIKDRLIKTAKNKFLGSFRAEDLQQMYKLPDAQDIYDKEFVAKFVKEKKDPFQMIQEWRRRENKFKQD